MSQRNERANQSFRLAAICAGLLLITVAVYWPTLGHDFVNYDDGDYVIANQHVQGGLTWENIKWAFTTGHASNWHPLTWISHMLDCQFYGPKPGGPHLTNLLFHAADTLLLFAVLFKMTGATWPSAFVAALFAWHPAHVESVAWISERKDVLSAFFWLLTMLAYVKYVKKSKVRSPKSKVFYGLALVLFGLGLMCKPMLVTLPFVLLLIDFWPLGRGAWCVVRVEEGKSKRKEAERSVSWSRLIVEKVPFLVLAIISSVVTFLVQRKGGAVSLLNVLPMGERIANAFVSYLRYVGKIVWPQNLSVLYPHPGSWPVGLVVAAVVFVMGVSVGVVWFGRARPYLVVGWFWFLGTLVPVIGLVQVGVQSMADRYTYVPAIGLFIIVAWGVPDLLNRLGRGGASVPASRAEKGTSARRRLAGTLAPPRQGGDGRIVGLSFASALILIACLMLTSGQIRYWKNGDTLFRHVVAVTKNNYLAYNNLGFYLYNHGKSDEALENYRKSVEINPNYDEAQNNIGHALNGMGKYDEAIEHLRLALRLKPNLVEAHNNMGNALSGQGRLDDAIAEYQQALHYKPDDQDAHNNLGIARAMQGRFDEAAELLREAVRLKPSDPGAHSNLGNVLAAQHKLDEAAKQYQISLQLDPEDARARNNLGNALSEQGRLDEAADNYRQALKLKADNPEANYNLGVILLRQGKPDEAKTHFAEAVRLKPDYASAKQQLDALANARKP